MKYKKKTQMNSIHSEMMGLIKITKVYTVLVNIFLRKLDLIPKLTHLLLILPTILEFLQFCILPRQTVELRRNILLEVM